jgi:murein DD-endopeptidase MepM/ murein hydrolase activator NlpD
MTRRRATAAVLAAALSLVPAAASTAGAPLSLPIECVPGETCFVQQYVDVDPGPEAADFRCGHLTSDDHDGTDLRVRPGASVAVLAPADGRVLRTRDGEPDRRDFEAPIAVPSDRACGNGVVLDHGDVETMLCHLAAGSVAVKPGDMVRRGDVIGRVGASGFADFHHVHLQVMRGRAVLDPFTGAASGTLACGRDGAPLWTAEATAALSAAAPVFVVGVGFHTAPVTTAMIEAGTTAAPDGGSLGRDAEALVAYGLAAGVRRGDEERIVLDGPGVAIDNVTPLERDRAQEMRFAGKRFPGGLAPGTYRMRFEVRRGGAVIASDSAVLTVR